MIILFIITVLLLIPFYFLWRNGKTHNFQLELLKKISESAEDDIRNNKDWKWRYKEFNKVSYNKILYSFKGFKPENYWNDLSFLEIDKISK